MSEVTEEMRKAGYRALVACKPMLSTDCEREAVEAIYLAMDAHRPAVDEGVVARAIQDAAHQGGDSPVDLGDAEILARAAINAIIGER